MNHIKINQNSNIEVVSKTLIEALYEESQDCDVTSSLTGNLQVTGADSQQVSFLTTKFPGLTINNI